MAAYNLSDPFKAERTKTAFGPYAKDPQRYANMYDKQMETPAIFDVSAGDGCTAVGVRLRDEHSQCIQEGNV